MVSPGPPAAGAPTNGQRRGRRRRQGRRRRGRSDLIFSMDRRTSPDQIRENPPRLPAELDLGPAQLAAALDLAVVHGRRSVDSLTMRRAHSSDSDSSDGDVDLSGHPGCPLIQELEEAGDSRPLVVSGTDGSVPQVDGARRVSLYSSFSLAIALHGGAITRAPAKLARWLSIDLRPSPDQIRGNPPCRVELDPTQVEAAIAALEAAIIHGRVSIESFTMRRVDSPDSDSSDGDYDGMSRHPNDRHHGYPLIQELEVGDARLFFSGTAGSVPGLPDAPQGGRVHRLSDVENPWILKVDAETFAGPRGLTNETTQTWIMRLKITTKLLGLSKQQLPEQNWEQYFSEIAGQSLEQLFVVACSFSDAIWSDQHISQMLTVFDTHVDVLFNIQDLPFSRSGEVAGIFYKMVNAFKGVIQGTPKDIRGSKESTIHPATFVLIQVLQFFRRNRDMVQSILESRDSNTSHCSEIFSCLISKLMESAESSFQEKGQRYIFILNNIYYVQQKDCHPGLLPPNVVNNLVALVEQYMVLYLGEYWVQPMLPYLDGDSLMKPRHSSVDAFIEKFYSMCNSQMTWKN